MPEPVLPRRSHRSLRGFGEETRSLRWLKRKLERSPKRMETVNDEFTDAALAFIDKAHKDGTPFFLWANSTRMHIFTHLKPQSIGKTGLGTYPDGMVEHDGDVKRLLDKLDELGIADNTL